MLNVVISIIVSIISVILSASIIRYPVLIKEKSIKALLPQNKMHYLFALGMVVSISLVTTTSICIYEFSWIHCFNRVIIVSLLWAISLIDYRKHIIPNKYLLVLLILRFIIVILQVIFERDKLKVELLSAFIAAFGIVLLFCLMRLVVKNGIGFGDVKLFGVIGLFFGIEGLLSVVFLSFTVSFFISVFMLITKKKTKKDYLAFAPSILIGTILAVVLFGA